MGRLLLDSFKRRNHGRTPRQQDTADAAMKVVGQWQLNRAREARKIRERNEKNARAVHRIFSGYLLNAQERMANVETNQDPTTNPTNVNENRAFKLARIKKYGNKSTTIARSQKFAKSHLRHDPRRRR